MGKLCKKCGNPDMHVKMKVISKNLDTGKSFKMTGCGECITASFLNAHEYAKKHNPPAAERVEKMAREIEQPTED